MNRNDISQALQDIFRDILGRPDLVLTDALSAVEVPEWDSFTHISLIGTIEKHYRIRFALGELDELKNVGDLVTAVEKKLARQA